MALFKRIIAKISKENIIKQAEDKPVDEVLNDILPELPETRGKDEQAVSIQEDDDNEATDS